MSETLEETLRGGYGFSDPAIVLGAALNDGTCIQEPKVRIPLAMMNRHGVIAGATGTGKTKTLQASKSTRRRWPGASRARRPPPASPGPRDRP